MSERSTFDKYKTAVLTQRQMQTIDEETIKLHFMSEDTLIERAAESVYRAVFFDVAKEYSEIVILAGPGNNGADGVALYRMLKLNGYRVRAFLLFGKEKCSVALKKQLDILDSYAIDITVPRDAYEVLEDIGRADYLVDAVFGIGLKRDIEGIVKTVFEEVNNEKDIYRAQIIAMDIPSGLCTDTGRVLGCALKADKTYTFSYAKRGLYLGEGKTYAGEVITEECGIFFTKSSQIAQKDDIMYTLPSGLSLWPERINPASKFDYGKVLVIAGSNTVYGAAYFSVLSAFYAGAGMVRVVTHENNRLPFEKSVPQAMYTFYTDTCPDIHKEIEWADSIVIGPGLGRGLSHDLVMQVLKFSKCTVIIDADALNVISSDEALKELFKSAEIKKVITPHKKEFSRLCGKSVSEIDENFTETADEFAKEYGCVTILKDAASYVTDGMTNHYVNIIGNDGMATAGSGDVLAGILGSFLAYNKCNPTKLRFFEAVCSAVYMHAKAGDAAMECIGRRPMTSDDILKQLLYI